MASVNFPPWLPDAAGIDLTASANIANVFPRANGYGPVPNLQPKGAALPAGCKGAGYVTLSDGSPIYFAGTATKLYRYDPSTSAWVDVSSTSTSYSVPPDDYWSFAQFGTQIFAAHANAPVQVLNFATGTTFAGLVGSGTYQPPRARGVTVVGDVLVLTGLVDTPNRIQWSALNNTTGWDPGVNGSDYQDFPDGGQVMACAGGDFGIVFQKSAIRKMIATGDATNLFQITVAERERGAIAPWSVIEVGPRIFFIDADGFYQFADGASTPIGSQAVNDWFKVNADSGLVQRTYGVADQAGPRVFWGFKSSADDRGILDTVLSYDWTLQRWTPLSLPVAVWMRGLTLATSIDQITTSIDALTTSLDSSIYAGGQPLLAAIDATNTLAFMAGGALQATLETNEAMLGRPNRVFVSGVRLNGDAPMFTVAVGVREDIASNVPVTWKAAMARSAQTGFAPARASGRYLRGRVVIPANQTWSYVTGVEPKLVAEGER